MDISSTLKVHKQRLINKNCYSEEEVHMAVEDAEKYKKINSEQPGFFDVAINTGKPTVKIQQLILDVHHLKIH